jgi:hypothetical protein
VKLEKDKKKLPKTVTRAIIALCISLLLLNFSGINLGLDAIEYDVTESFQLQFKEFIYVIFIMIVGVLDLMPLDGMVFCIAIVTTILSSMQSYKKHNRFHDEKNIEVAITWDRVVK